MGVIALLPSREDAKNKSIKNLEKERESVGSGELFAEISEIIKIRIAHGFTSCKYTLAGNTTMNEVSLVKDLMEEKGYSVNIKKSASGGRDNEFTLVIEWD